jgi:nitrogen-specific signal transduction histidine kinase
VGKHQGTIEVDSKVGAGTCFTLTLPVEPPGGLAALTQNTEKSAPALRREQQP